MPQLKKGSRPIHHPAGALTADSDKVRYPLRSWRDLPDGTLSFTAGYMISKALEEAIAAFVEEHGRMPKLNMIVFTGGFFDNGAVIEIVEYP